MKQKGNLWMYSLGIIAMIVVLLCFVMGIFMSEVNSLLYNIKVDLYAINKSAIISVNKGITSRQAFSYDTEAYRQYLEDMLRANYQLNENLENATGVVKRVKILEFQILKKGKKDSVTNQTIKSNTIHTVMEVTIKPIFLAEALESIFTFPLHEDVVLQEVQV